jgi:hypothetical protein
LVGRKEVVIMIRISGVRFDQLLAEALERDPQGRIELLPALPIHPDAQFTWRGRVRGRGVYMGPADEHTAENGEKYMALADPDTFIAEN